MSSTQLQNKSFHVVEKTRTSAKCEKMKTARALLFFVVKYANLSRSRCRRRRGYLSFLLMQSCRQKDRERFPFVWKNREELSGKRNRKIFLGQNGTRRACSFYTDLR